MLTATNQGAGSIASREKIARQVVDCSYIVTSCIKGSDIGLTATTIDIVSLQLRVCTNLEQQTIGTGHSTFVTTAIDVTDFTFLQVPCRTDSHIGLVVTTKETTYLILATGRMREGGVDAHPLNTFHSQQLHILCATNFFDTVDNMATVVHIDHRVFVDGCIVTTTVCINDGTTYYLEIGPVDGRLDEILRGGGYRIFAISDIIFRFINFMRFSIVTIVIFTIATSEELTDVASLVAAFRSTAHTDKGIPGVSDLILTCFHQFCWNGGRFTDGSGNIVTSIDTVDEYKCIVRSMLAIDVDKGRTSHIGHTGTAEHVAVDIAHAYCDCGTSAGISGITTTIHITTNFDVLYGSLKICRSFLCMNHHRPTQYHHHQKQFKETISRARS